MSESNRSGNVGYGPCWAPGERRLGRRRPSSWRVACHYTAARAGEPWWEEAIARDVSCNGLGLSLRRRLEPGSLVIIRAGERYLSARVVYTVPRESSWVAGCKLHTELSEAELGALG